MVAITRDDRDGVDVIQLDGEVDLTNADSLLAAVEATRSASVVLDLSLVAFLDSSGIRAIDRGHRHLNADGRKETVKLEARARHRFAERDDDRPRSSRGAGT